MTQRLNDTLTRELYDELRSIAHRHLSREAPGHTLQPTALANEACLRLLKRDAPWEDRAHFLALAATIMRSILVDTARRRQTERHGGAYVRVSFAAAEEIEQGGDIDVLELDEALDELEALDPRAAEVVRLRFFAGADLDEIARLTGVSARTVKRDWRAARLWLYDRVAGEG
jgi:RNA polymerase sigma factor (TIGR02999 family)